MAGPRQARLLRNHHLEQLVHILFVTHCFPRYAEDHAGRFLFVLAKALLARGHRITVVSPHAPGLAGQEDMDGVQVRRFRYGSDETETLAYAGNLQEQLEGSWRARLRLMHLLLQQRRMMQRVLHEARPDLIHLHWLFPAGIVERVRFGRATPVVVTSHGTDLFLADRGRVARVLASQVIRQTDYLTVVSSPLQSRAVRLGIAADRVSVIPMPVETALFLSENGGSDGTCAAQSSHGRTRSDAPDEIANDAATNEVPDSPARSEAELLFVGRLTERKGCVHALWALAYLRARRLDARLTVIGDGPERAALEQAARELRVASAVTWLGMQPPTGVAERMSRARALVVPSVTDRKGEQEGYGMVVVEAMWARTPVVAFASGGIIDLVQDGHNGWLVPEGHAAGLANALHDIIQRPEEARRRAEVARVDVEQRYAPTRIAEAFENVYATAIHGRAQRDHVPMTPMLSPAAR